MIAPLFWFWYATGALLLVLLKLPKSLEFANGLFLVLYALYACSLYHKARNRAPSNDPAVSGAGTPGTPGRSGRGGRRIPLPLTAAAIWLGGMGVEWVGVHTGLLFGDYRYSAALGPRLFGVPVTLGFAWIAVVLNAWLLAPGEEATGDERSRRAAQRGTNRPGTLRRAALTGGLAVLLDLVLDPVAQSREYWSWGTSGGFYGVPWSNFAGWFLAAALLALTVERFVPPAASVRAGGRLYQAMLLLFGLISLRDGLPLCALIAAAGILLAEGRVRHASRRQASRV